MQQRFTSCAVTECSSNAHRDANGREGYCVKHFKRWKTHGDPHKVGKCPSPAKDWLFAHVLHDRDDCLIWPFATNPYGYATVSRPNNGTLALASTLMCELANGHKPTIRHECAHSCGRGAFGCVNPRHLRWATPTENQRERVDHGTSNRGTRQWAARLTEDDIHAIRRAADTETMTSIAKRHKISPSHVSKIVSRDAWAWLP